MGLELQSYGYRFRPPDAFGMIGDSDETTCNACSAAFADNRPGLHQCGRGRSQPTPVAAGQHEFHGWCRTPRDALRVADPALSLGRRHRPPWQRRARAPAGTQHDRAAAPRLHQLQQDPRGALRRRDLAAAGAPRSRHRRWAGWFANPPGGFELQSHAPAVGAGFAAWPTLLAAPEPGDHRPDRGL
ncbi:hypothetical protein D3C84_860850 [compost metagenome]